MDIIDKGLIVDHIFYRKDNQVDAPGKADFLAAFEDLDLQQVSVRNRHAASENLALIAVAGDRTERRVRVRRGVDGGRGQAADVEIALDRTGGGIHPAFFLPGGIFDVGPAPGGDAGWVVIGGGQEGVERQRDQVVPVVRAGSEAQGRVDQRAAGRRGRGDRHGGEGGQIQAAVNIIGGGDDPALLLAGGVGHLHPGSAGVSAGVIPAGGDRGARAEHGKLQQVGGARTREETQILEDGALGDRGRGGGQGGRDRGSEGRGSGGELGGFGGGLGRRGRGHGGRRGGRGGRGGGRGGGGGGGQGLGRVVAGRNEGYKDHE